MSQFNKGPIAAAVLAALGLAFSVNEASAGAVTAATGEFSKQHALRTGAVTAASVSRLPDATITTAAAYQSGDRMTITLGGTAGARFESPDTPTLACTNAGAGGAQGAWAYNAASSSTTTAVFVAAAAGATGSTCTFAAADLTNVSLGAAAAAATIQLSANMTRDVTTVDTAPATTVATVVDQFSATVRLPWNAAIDYATDDGRKFVAAAAAVNVGNAAGQIAVNDTALVDTLAVELFDRQGTTINDAALDATAGLVIVINGDFSVLNNTAAEGCVLPGTGNGNSIVVENSAGAVGTVTSTNCDSITVTLTAQQVADTIATNSDTLLIKFNIDNVDGRKDLKWQSFTGTATYKYVVTGVSAVVQDDAEATFAPGAHTASGSRIFVPYVPVGTGISQVIQLANNSARTGTVTMTARNQAGTECTSANMGGRVSISANRITDLGSMLAAGIANCYATGSHKLYVVVTADIPDTAAELYTSYNVSGNRVAVVNSSNGSRTDNNVGGANSSR